METIDEFKKQQIKTVDTLKKLLNFLQEGKGYGVNVAPEFMEKLENSIKSTSDEKLKIALIGGFSEGKTSIVAAWLEEYDKSTMKIDQQESSDEVRFYETDSFMICDTPGLFGFKEDVNKEKYKEKTEKFVSEAHLVLYVVNPSNPIKEGHKDELIWLFEKLNLLPRTIFVLSSFDKVVDIEDEEDYKNGLKIKHQNIIKRLKDFDLISNDDITIVAVSANPFDRGIEYWLSHLNEFKKLSRIKLLQEATTDKIKSAGTNANLIEASKKSIVHDILIHELPIVENFYEKTCEERNQLIQVYDELEKNLEKTKSNLSRTRIELRESILDFFKDLILQTKHLDIDTLGDFFEENIGNEGKVLETKIQNIFERQLGSIIPEISKMQSSLNAGIQHYNNVIDDYVIDKIKYGSKFMQSGIKFTAGGVKNVRDFIKPTLKFKPWEAIKMAKNINKSVSIIGTVLEIGVEVYELWERYKKAEALQETKDKFVKDFEKMREECLEFINDDNKFSEFFPEYISLKEQKEELHKLLQEKQSLHENFSKWREHAKEIAVEAEFYVVD
jgi:predicted GTPase